MPRPESLVDSAYGSTMKAATGKAVPADWRLVTQGWAGGSLRWAGALSSLTRRRSACAPRRRGVSGVRRSQSRTDRHYLLGA